jgi:CRISPR-associated protein Cmr5
MGLHHTLEQLRAKAAWECATAAKSKNPRAYKEYVNQVKKLPSLIMTNGLGQTLAFLAAKAKTKEDERTKQKTIDTGKTEGLLYTHIEGWLTRTSQEGEPYRAPYSEALNGEGAEPARLLFRIARADSATYRRATTEALAFCSWLKSCADALQESKTDTGGGNRT